MEQMEFLDIRKPIPGSCVACEASWPITSIPSIVDHHRVVYTYPAVA